MSPYTQFYYRHNVTKAIVQNLKRTKMLYMDEFKFHVASICI